ncbi:FAD-dependent monooxygenase [Nonomuraea sp. K274]|uniref:FAD-dependent monooxygenase n=1 Tax=Nonomuraea cypriaca TaxID=1187855 RepID=A0A931ABH5_9ACTN|nr:FAD-dependent monooxygenase [Nonomuraea cypriaca]MBF8186287.1 FAD-dependent monooxygenase [Nonomuraea cypriaca]
MKKNSRPVVVVGGGIGGLTAALALRLRGVEVALLERADEFGEVGAGLQLAPNATRILAEWGLLDKTLQLGYEPRSIVLKDALDGAELTRQDLGEEFRARYGAPYVVIHRSDLHTILLDAAREAGVELITASEVDSVTEREPAGATITVTNGGTWEADACIAADGLTSRLRDSIVGDQPIASGYVAYRGTLPRGEDAFEDVVAWVGPGCHFVRYSLRNGEMLNQVAVFRSPRFAEGHADWGGVEELDNAFSECCDEVKHGLAHLWRDRRWPMYDRAPTQQWRRGSTLLVGDAAHPMLQYLAQGACQAIEDAATLGRALDRHDGMPTTGQWQPIFDQVVAEREPQTTLVQNSARVWGDIWHTEGLGRLLRNELMQRRDTKDFRYSDWLYGAR